MNAINWFEIPAVDFDRAVTFYTTILQRGIHNEVFWGIPNGVFAYEDPGVGGSIVKSDVVPSTSGSVVYLNAGHDLAGILARVEPAGGKVIMPKTPIGPMGTMAMIIDTEGNRVGLHSEDLE